MSNLVLSEPLTADVRGFLKREIDARLRARGISKAKDRQPHAGSDPGGWMPRHSRRFFNGHVARCRCITCRGLDR